MAIYDPTDTLAYHDSRILKTRRDLSSVLCSNTAPLVAAYSQKNDNEFKHPRPETEALEFYCLNHAAALISARFSPYEPLPLFELQVIERYHSAMTASAVRAFYYLIIICTREARHNKTPGILGKAETPFSPELKAWFAKYGYNDETSIHKHWLDYPPKVSIAEFARALSFIFYRGKFGSNYGGIPWGKVADCLVSFITGEISAEIMLDVVWTLAHNNGPIFNKGHFYKGCNRAVIERILDVQRSGQTPLQILYDSSISGFISIDLQQFTGQIVKHFSDEFPNAYVDWHKVEALGAIGKYKADIQKQEKLYPSPNKMAIGGTNFYVLPGLTVKIMDEHDAQS